MHRFARSHFLDLLNERVVQNRKNTGHRNDCYGGPLFPPERGQVATRRRMRKGKFALPCDNIVTRKPIAPVGIWMRFPLPPSNISPFRNETRCHETGQTVRPQAPP